MWTVRICSQVFVWTLDCGVTTHRVEMSSLRAIRFESRTVLLETAGTSGQRSTVKTP